MKGRQEKRPFVCLSKPGPLLNRDREVSSCAIMFAGPAQGRSVASPHNGNFRTYFTPVIAPLSSVVSTNPIRLSKNLPRTKTH